MAYRNPPKRKLSRLQVGIVPNRTDLPVGSWGPWPSPFNPAGFVAINPAPWSWTWGATGCVGAGSAWGSALGADTSNTEYYATLAARTLAEYDAASDPELAAAKLKVQIERWESLSAKYPSFKTVLATPIAKGKAKLAAYEKKAARTEDLYAEGKQISFLSKIGIGAGILVGLSLTALLVTKTVQESKR